MSRVVSSTLKLATQKWDGIRFPQGLRILSLFLASKSHFLNPCSFRDRSFYDFFPKNFKNLDFKKSLILRISIPVVGNCEGGLRGCVFCL